MSDEPSWTEHTGDDRPLYGERRRRMMRIVVLVAVAALVLPGALSLYSVVLGIAERTCAATAAAFDGRPAEASVRFDLFGPGGPGWICAVPRSGGGERVIANLGVFPAAPHVALPGERPA